MLKTHSRAPDTTMSVGAPVEADVKSGAPMDVDEDKTVVYSSCQSTDILASGAPTIQSQRSEKETSSYGKSNFVLPVTFFDIQSNLNYLNECCPLTINVVDCDKYPWYYKNYLRSDFQITSSEGSKLTSKPMNNVDNNNCVEIDLTDKMYDKFEQENYTLQQDCSYLKKAKRKKNRNKKKSHVDNSRNLQDDLKSIAISRMDICKIDFKKNKGLVGLKITHRTEVMNNISDKAENVHATNHLDLPMPVEVRPMVRTGEAIETKDVDEYMSGVDKALCKVGTIIKPVNDTNQNTENESLSKSGTKKSEMIIEMSKRKLSKCSVTNRHSKGGVSSKISGKMPIPTVVNNKALTGPLEPKECNSNPISINGKKYNKTALKAHAMKTNNKDIKHNHCKKKGDNGINKQSSKKRNNNQKKERSDHKSKLVKELFSPKSPVFSCSIKPNKVIIPNCNTKNQVHRENNNEFSLMDINLNARNTNAKDVPPNISISSVKENSTEKSDILTQNGPVKPLNESKSDERSNKNTFTITPVSIDKLRYINASEPSTSVKLNSHKPVPEQPVQCTPNAQSEQGNNARLLIDDHKEVITVTASKEKSNEKCNVAQAEPRPAINNIRSFYNAPQIAYQHNQSVKPQVSSLRGFTVIENDHKNKQQMGLKQQSGSHLPIQFQVYQGPKFRRHNPAQVPSKFPTHKVLLATPRPPNPQVIDPSYHPNNYPSSNMSYPYVYQNNWQQNINLHQNVPPQNVGNNYWPWFPPHIPPPPPPLDPPPPPPPSENYENSLRKIAPKPNILVGIKTGYVDKVMNLRGHPLSNKLVTITSYNKPGELSRNQSIIPEKDTKVQNEKLGIKPMIDEPAVVVEPVTSKTEMFQELQKETMKINTILKEDIAQREQQSTVPAHVQIPSSNETVKNSNEVFWEDISPKQINQEPNTQKHVPSFACDSKTLYNKWKEDSKHKVMSKPEDLGAWKALNENVSKPGSCSSSRKDDKVGDSKRTSFDTNKKRFYKSRAGPLCMKNRSGPFARYQTPPPTQRSPTNKGYSPPILPIPTFQKSLEMFANDVQIQPNNIDINDKWDKPNETRENPVNKSSFEERPKKNIEYFYVNKDEKTLKKITLQDYQKRVARGDGKCIVLKKDSSCKRAKRNQSSEQDLGYDSDVTVKL